MKRLLIGLTVLLTVSFLRADDAEDRAIRAIEKLGDDHAG